MIAKTTLWCKDPQTAKAVWGSGPLPEHAMLVATVTLCLSNGDFVTAADIRAEDTLYELLMKARPGYGFLGEERGMIEGTDKSHTWIVDPIDGTTNFMHAMPHFAITVGLERRAPDGSSEIVAGVTYNPVMNELFWAEKGKGCYLNDQRIRVAGRKDLSESLIATGLPFIGKTGHAQAIKDIERTTNHDVKAVEYWLKSRCEVTSMSRQVPSCASTRPRSKPMAAISACARAISARTSAASNSTSKAPWSTTLPSSRLERM